MTFRIHAVLPTNNEVDILEECIDSASRWADAIYVFDTGSTDGSIELLSFLERKYTSLKIYKAEFREFDFTKTISEVFRHYASESKLGDWWCPLSTDEQYPENPRIFLSKVDPRYNSVWSCTLNYYFTEDELNRWDSCGAEFSLGFPHFKFSDFLRHYKSNYSEVRFYKHHKRLSKDAILHPKYFSPVSPDRILLQHFQYRHPLQIVKRVRSRRSIYFADELRQFKHEVFFGLSAAGIPVFDRSHYLKAIEAVPDDVILQSRIIKANILNVDNKDGRFVIETQLLPPTSCSVRSLVIFHKEFFRSFIRHLYGYVKRFFYFFFKW